MQEAGAPFTRVPAAFTSLPAHPRFPPSPGPELFPSGLLDRLLPGYSLGLSNTPKPQGLGLPAATAPRQASPSPFAGAPASGGAAAAVQQAVQLQQALGAMGSAPSDTTTLHPSASLLMSAAAGMALPSPGAPGSGGGSGCSDALPGSTGSWWALDSPMATLLSPASDQQARQLEEQSLALSQLIGSLKAEISSIEAQQQRLVQQQQAHKRDRERLLQVRTRVLGKAGGGGPARPAGRAGACLASEGRCGNRLDGMAAAAGAL